MKKEVTHSSELFKRPDPTWADTSRDFEILTVEELESLEPSDALVGPFFRRPGLSVAYGAPKTGKTFLLLDMALRKATGLPWHDGSSTSPELVLWIAAEGDRSIKNRVRSWRAANHVEETPNFRVINCPVNLFSQEGFDLVVALGRRGLRPSLIIFDTLARCSTGADENRASDVQRIVDETYQLSETLQACVVLIHHSGKEAKGPRGSSALLAAADQVFKVSLTGRRIRVKSVAERDSAAFEDLELDLEEVGDSLVVRPSQESGQSTGNAGEQRVFAFLKARGVNGWTTSLEIRTELDLAETTLSRRLKSLIKRGLVEEASGQGKGRPKVYRSAQDADVVVPYREKCDIRQVFPPPPPLQGGVGGGGNDYLKDAS